MRTRLTSLNPQVILFFISIIALASSAIFLSFGLLHNGARRALPKFRKLALRSLTAVHMCSYYTIDAGSLTFDIPPGDPVAMIIHNTHRYEITLSGAEEFAALLPPGGHLIHLGTPPKAYTPTLFHQMKCLGIIHAALIDIPADSAATPTPLVSHCLNYLRQCILCRPNLRLESVMDANAASEKEYETVCRNWEGVYAAAEQNQLVFSTLRDMQKQSMSQATG